MAVQNRKTDRDRKLRQYAHRLVDLYLKMIFAAEADAGWDGPTVIGRMMDFAGDLPEPSGFCGVDRMPERIRLIQHWPPQFRVAHRLMVKLTARQREALCVDRMYRGRRRMVSDTTNQRRTEVYWSDKRCAGALGISQSALRSRINDGYRALEAVIAPAAEQRTTAA